MLIFCYSIAIELQDYTRLISLNSLFTNDYKQFCAISNKATDSFSEISSVIFDKTNAQGILAEDLNFIADQNRFTIEKDYRFGKISVEEVQMEENNNDFNLRKKTFASVTSEEVQFISGHTDLTYGVLHLFKQNSDEVDLSGINTLCALSVPSYMTTADFLRFTAPYRKFISHYRIIRDSQPNRYMVLMKFSDKIDQFYSEYHGKLFSTLSAETCQLAYVRDIEEFGTKQSSLQTRNNVISTISSSRQQKVSDIEQDLAIDLQQMSSSNSQSPTKQSYEGELIELPTCPVCLERMDQSTTGLITILCHHSFHCQCLSKWTDSTCPVCRFSQTAVPKSSYFEHASKCSKCNQRSNLWICLICGSLGCGRYHQAHAYEHFKQTQHLYALELETQRVWDYVGDGYVHRLIRDKTDGKVVELPSTDQQSMDEGLQNSSHDFKKAEDKIDRLTYEFQSLLTTSLESQRAFYENQLLELEFERDSSLAHFQSLQHDVNLVQEDNARLQSLVLSLEQELSSEKSHVKSVQDQLTSREAKLKQLEQLLEKFKEKLKEEIMINDSLRSNQKQWTDKVQQLQQQLKDKDVIIEDLNEQVKDLMAFLEARQEVERQVQNAKSESERLDIIHGTFGVSKQGGSSGRKKSK